MDFKIRNVLIKKFSVFCKGIFFVLKICVNLYKVKSYIKY